MARLPCCHAVERDNRSPRFDSRTGLMADARYDVLGIGNAIFDVLVRTDEKFLADHGMTKGGMAMIDEARGTAIYQDMGPATEMSRGSAASAALKRRTPWTLASSLVASITAPFRTTLSVMIRLPRRVSLSAHVK